MNRTRKQFAYGSLYLVILTLIAGSIYFFVFKPAPSCSDNKQNQKEVGVDCGGPCIPCEVKGLSLATEELKIFPAGQNQITLLARVKNPSPNFPVRFSYKFNLGGTLLNKTLGGNTIIAPGASKYLVIPGVSIAAEDVKSIDLETTEPNWQSESKTEVKNIGLSVQTNVDQVKITVTGTLVNKSAMSFRQIDLTALLFGREGEILNASTARLEKIEAFSEKQFIIFFPESEGLMKNLDSQKTEVYWEINE